MKARHEFDAPETCHKCSVSHFWNRRYGDGQELLRRKCGIANTDCTDYAETRAPFCPLKIVPEGSRCIMCESDRCESQFRVGDDYKYLCMDCLREIGERARRCCLEPESEQLKPCPFCGGGAIMDYIKPHTHSERLAKIMPDYKGGLFIEMYLRAVIRE